MTTTPATQAHPIDMLREMLAREIERTSPTESFMIRSGLLADLLGELASLRQAHSLPGDVGMREALEKIDKWCCPVLCTNCADNRETARTALSSAALTPSALSGDAGEGALPSDQP